MKNILFILIMTLILFSFNVLSAQENDSTDVVAQHQIELFGISENYTLGQAAEVVDLSVDSLVTHFKLNKNDNRIAGRKLTSLRVNPEDIVKYKDDITYGFNHSMALFDCARLNKIPIKKLLEYLNLPIQDKSNYTKTLFDLKIKPSLIIEKVDYFATKKMELGAILTILGMLVVFSALAITAIVLTQMIHLGKFGKPSGHGHSKTVSPASVQTPVGKIKAPRPEDLSSAAIVAVITAIHLRTQELEEENKLMLTWKRANISMWQASGKVQFPNSKFQQNKCRS
ncbi:MAG TPA: OadG family protein [Candidatus Cloacimonadota bacterium]|nr:OadG family protein [Candidatus Cloacimonadota bacterium]